MDDREFIEYLCRQIMNICSDGDYPDFETIEGELQKRGIDPEDVFAY